MSWYAIDSVDDAIDATRSFLFPVEPVTWLKLALISIFVSMGGGGVSSGGNLVNIPANIPAETPQPEPAPGPDSTSPPPEVLHDIVPTDPAVIAAIVGAVILVILGLILLSETLRLVFYDALRTGTVRLRKPARRRFGQALRLFVFKTAVAAAFAAPFVTVGIVATQTSVDLLSGTPGLVGLVVGIGAALLSFGLYVVISRATNEFVTPIMVLTDSGVIDGWSRFWPVLRGNLAQFGVYVVVHFLLLLAISIGQSLIGLLIFGIVGTVGALVGLVVAFGIFGGASAAVGSTAGLVVLGLIALLTLFAIAVFTLPVGIVVLTYVISYEVSVLAAADEELQLLPESESAADQPTTPTV